MRFRDIKKQRNGGYMKAPDPIAFSLFGIDIRWYGVLIACGVMLAVAISYRRAVRHDIDPENVLDAAICMLPAGVIGARLYYVVFDWDLYRYDLSEIFDIRAGGLAIHGGLIFGMIALLILCRVKRIDFVEMLDLFFPSVALAQAVGRWGNFFNGEAYGSATDLPWAIVVNGQHVHPTFLYESIWCLLIFVILIRIDDHRRFKGQTACLYGMLYSIERFLVEALRTDSLMIGIFKQAQVLSAFIFVISLAIYIYLYRKQSNRVVDPDDDKNQN